MLLLLSGLLASFNVLVPQEDKRKLGCPTLPKEKAPKNYPHSTSIAPNLRLSIDQRFSFLEKVNLVPNICFLRGLDARIVRVKLGDTQIQSKQWISGYDPMLLTNCFQKRLIFY